MGGVSVADIKSENGILNFSGELSLENRGGFASFQGISRPCQLPWPLIGQDHMF